MVGASFTVAAAVTILRAKNGIVAFGNAQVDTAQSKFGGSSALFDGTGDYLSSTSPLSLGTGDWTIECWIRTGTALKVIFDNRIPTSSAGVFFLSAAGYASYYVDSTGAVSGTTNCADSTWRHIAYSKSGSTLRVFVSGTIENTKNSYSSNMGTDRSFYIGSQSPLDLYFNGHMDEFRISNTARYTANFTPSTTPFVNDANTLFLMHADGTDASTFFEDDNGLRSQKGITAVGNAQISTAQSKFGGSSYVGDGTGDYLSVSPLQDFAFGTGDFTIEFWFRSNGAITTSTLLLDARPAGGNGAYPAIYLPSSVPTYYVSSANRISGSTTLSTNTWYHLAISRSGTSTKMFLNGTQEGSTYTDTTTYLEPSLWIIGAQSYTIGTASWNGWIDEFRVSNTARYTAAFTAPTQPFVNDANTLLLIHADGTNATTVFYDDTGSRTQNGVQAAGNAQVDTAQSKFGGSSALFDGTDDYLKVYDNNTISVGTGDYTVEAWIRPTSVGSQSRCIFDFDIATNGSNPIFYISSSSKLSVYNTAMGGSEGPTTVTTNTWHHVVLSRSSGETKVALNGVWELSKSNSYSITNGSFRSIGAATNASDDFVGHIDEFRVSNIAKYNHASNFTPSTTPFQNDANTLLLLHMDGTDASTVFFDDNGIAPYTP